ncbi:MAG: mandelate racemase/muconate lactonizing enzyme family protein, partial [Gemmatimonadota bacterium]
MVTPSMRLRITDIQRIPLRAVREVGTLEPAWDPGGQMGFSVGGGAYVEVRTDAGLTGIGPAPAPGVVDAARARLAGQDPFAIEQHAATLRYYASGSPYQGAAGIDIALWDLIGKACGQPLYKLWGGGRDRVPAYASMVRLSTAAERAELAARLAGEGWQALKLRLHCATIPEDLAIVEQVRRAAGDRMVIMADANQAQSSGTWQPGVRWDFRRALDTARELDRLGCYWLEEPLPRYAFADLARINQEVALPLAGGENNPGLHEFAQMLREGVYDVLQPESMVCCGVTALRKIG